MTCCPAVTWAVSIAFAADSFAAVTAAGATPGATGEDCTTHRRKPRSVDGAARASRSSHRATPPRTASGVVSSPARASPSSRWRAIAWDRMTPMAVSLASAYATGGITQIARSRNPCPAASMFIAMLVATAPTFRTRARIACRPCSASAIPSDAKTRAATSGMAASSAAIGATPLAANTIRYWASYETTAAAAASTPSAPIAARSHVAARSVAVPSPRGWRRDRLTIRVPFVAGASSNSRSSTPNGRHV